MERVNQAATHDRQRDTQDPGRAPELGDTFQPQVDLGSLVARIGQDAGRLNPPDLLHLQRTVGNRAVNQMLAGSRQGPPAREPQRTGATLVQRMLTIGSPVIQRDDGLTAEQKREVRANADALKAKFGGEGFLAGLFGGSALAGRASAAQHGLLNAADLQHINCLSRLAPNELQALGFLDPVAQVPRYALDVIKKPEALATMPVKHQMQVTTWIDENMGGSVQKTAFSYAVRLHLSDRRRLKEVIEEGLLSQDERTRNSCEAARMGLGKNRGLMAMTPTHDADARAKAVSKEAGVRAYFGIDQPIYNAQGAFVEHPGAYYAVDEPDNGANIFCRKPEVIAFQHPTKGIGVLSPAERDSETILEFIRHEVQHVFDRHTSLVSVTSTGEAYDMYKSEYRAYTFQASPEHAGAMGTKVQQMGYEWREKQFKIFKHIYDNYPYVKKYWALNEKVTTDAGQRKTFQQAVVEFWEPASQNPQNSIRVHLFLDELARSMSSGITDKLRQAIQDLKPEEKIMVLHNPDIDLKEQGPAPDRGGDELVTLLQTGIGNQRPSSEELYGHLQLANG